MKTRRKTQKPLEPMEILLRAYVPPRADNRPKFKRPIDQGPSEYCLIFDTETTVDTQRVKFGTYQFRKSHEILEKGIFFDRNALANAEIELLRNYAELNALKLIPINEFIDRVFFENAYSLRATFIGFNLPFDISRLAINHGSARGKLMRGGFTFKLSEQKYWPNIQIRHLSRTSAFIQFTTRPGQFDTRGSRKRRLSVPPRRGYFVDLNTLGSALLSHSFSLKSLADLLKTPSRKLDVAEHGGPLSEEYIRYAVQDTQVTWECYLALIEKFKSHNFSEKLANQIQSGASIGKAYLNEMNILPWREMQPNFSNKPLGIILSTYFGGRSEVHIRREITQVAYCDFLSMYPTVCTLMNLWRFVIAKGIRSRDSTKETRAFLKDIKLGDLQSPNTWRALTTLVQIEPDEDILPVRARYEGSNQQTIGLNYLTCENPLWFTLTDIIASKLLTGKCPRILKAITFTPDEPQDDLRKVAIAGNPDYLVDPLKGDFFRQLIDLRNSIKSRLKTCSAEHKPVLETQQLTLKIIANSTSYGVFIELNVEDLPKLETRLCHGNGDPFKVEIDKSENPGQYFNPLLATLITGAARLMLAITETLAKENGLDWAFCDTDSMAIAKTEAIGATFNDRVQIIRNWFNPLNPYSGNSPILKLEDANYEIAPNSRKLNSLYFIGISAKRYVLFNLGENNEIIIRKASAHGLGHLIAPYSESEAPTSIPAPELSLKLIGVERWQYDLWHQIIHAAIKKHPDQIDLEYHPNLKLPAASRYASTTPALLNWFKSHNLNRLYGNQVRPFNFMVAFQAWQSHLNENKSSQNSDTPKPVAPFDNDVARAAKNCFDRETGDLIDSKSLKTYSEILAQFHLRPESKFENGDYLNKGITERRNIQAASIRNIGKESNKWEEQYYLGSDETSQIKYGSAKIEYTENTKIIRRAIKQFGQRRIAKKVGISRQRLRAILVNRKTSFDIAQISKAISEIQSEEAAYRLLIGDALKLINTDIKKNGLSNVARKLNLDGANLRKMVTGNRAVPKHKLEIIRRHFPERL